MGNIYGCYDIEVEKYSLQEALQEMNKDSTY